MADNTENKGLAPEEITEEAAAYFAGDRSEEDVLKNIQNRCDLIVKERG